MQYYLYKITNITNNKCYYGSHKTTNIDDGYMGSGIAIKRAIKKYGIQSFKKEIISYHADEQSLRDAEDALLKTLINEIGLYNLKYCAIGGNTRSHYTDNQHKDYIQKLIDNPKSPIGKSGADNIMFGRVRSLQFKQDRAKGTKEMMANLKLNNHQEYLRVSHAKSVIARNVATNDTIRFICMRDCASHFKIKPQGMSKRINTGKVYDGHTFQYEI